MTSLKRHPFPVVAHFDRVVAISFAFPAAVLRPMVPAGLEIDTTGSETRIHTARADGTTTLDLTFDDPGGEIPLPAGSPFPDWRTARRFAGPMPFTFSPKPDGSFVVIEGNRADWTPRPVALKSWQVALFDQSPLQGVTPRVANAFAVDDIPYRWSRGRLVKPVDPA